MALRTAIMAIVVFIIMGQHYAHYTQNVDSPVG